MKRSIIFFLFILISHLFFGQNQKFTMAEAVNGLRSNLIIENISNPSWIKDTKSIIHIKKNGYWITELPSLKSDTLVSLYQLNKNFTKENTLKSLPNITFLSSKNAYFKSDSIYYQLEKSVTTWIAKKWFFLPKNADHVVIIPEKNAAVYTIDNNLYYKEGDKITKISNETNSNMISGQAVHRNEFGINEGIFLAPNQENIAYYKMDQTMVEDYPVIDWSVTPAINHNIKYPMAGRKSHEVKLGVYNTKNRTHRFLKIEGDKEQYLTCITWSPDSKYLFVGVLNRGQNDLKMNMYDAESGNYIKTIFEEKSDKYVEPQHSLIFFPNSSTDFIWQSQRTGYNHLFHYNIDRGLVSQITKGDYVVTEVLGFNEKKKDIYFISTKESPLERNLYRINWNTFRMQKIDQAKGVHSAILSKDGNWIYDSYTNETTPRKVDIYNTNNLKSYNVLTAVDPLKNYQRPEIRNVTLKADDGTPLYGKLILPTNFDARKKYPVIVYLYNGPHVQLITNSFPASGNLWYEYMAQNGYVIFTMDGRGSGNRGLQFEQAIFRHLGEVEMKDQLKGVDYLKSLPFVDSQRMGIHGWSFGGFMTTSLMLKYPEVFKVGVAGGPVMDWKMYEIMYTERYMDTPEENPEGYAKSNLLDKVQNLKGHLLLIHGTQDETVVWQHSINFLKSAVDNSVQLDYFVYPGYEHNVRGKDRVHLMQKVTDYFNLYLKK